MAKTYTNTTALEIRITLGEDISETVTRTLIKFRKPNGFEGYWPAEVIDAEQGIIGYSFPTSSDGLDDTGYWTFWGYIYYKDGTVNAGDPNTLAVYKEGKTYIAFPYGRQSGEAEELEMAQEAYEILYDNTNSGLVGTNVQEAMDELDASLDAVVAPASSAVTYDNTTSGLTATTVKTAIDEVDANVDVINALIAQANQIVYVDMNRIDTYTADGTINKPFTTITLAIGAASPGAVIRVSAGTYTGENILLLNNMTLIGMGVGKTIISDPITVPASGNCSLKEFTTTNAIIGGAADTVVTNVNVVGVGLAAPSVSIAGNLRAYNFNVSSTDMNAVAVSAGLVMIENSIISTTAPAFSAINQSGGNLILESIEADNTSTEATLKSTGGSVRALSSRFSNAGAGLGISIVNTATATMPNVLSNVIQLGGIDTGASYTVLEGVEGGDPTGSNFSRRPATQLGYDNTYSEVTATNLQEALDAIYGSCKSGPAVDRPVAPTNAVEFYYDIDTDDLNVWNGATWRVISTT